MKQTRGLTIGRPSSNKEAAIKALNNQKYSRINIDLPPEIHKNLKLFAIQRGVSVANLIRELIDKNIPLITIKSG